MTINIDVKDALGSTQTIRMLDDGTGKKIAQSVASDASGNALIGQKTMAASLPVAIASDQSAVPVSGTVAATQSGTWNIGSLTTLPALVAGTAIIGKVGIDQTTPGTTNKVDIGNTGTVAATQSGTWNIGTITTLTGITNVVHVDDNAGSLTVDDGGSSISIDDNGGSVTIDAPVGTPAFVRISNGTAAVDTLPVSGTFWQATQPVSIASMPSTPVTGTFWQATQPVSGPLTDAQLRATAVSVSDTHTTAAAPLAVRLSDGTNFYNASGGGGGVAEDSVHTSGDTGSYILGVRQDADSSPVSADGDYQGLLFNDSGRLKVSTQPAALVATTGTITTSTSTVVADVTKASNVAIFIKGTFAGVNITFEGSNDGGTTYFGVQAVRSNANTVELTSGVLGAAPAYCWEVSVNAYTHFRVRATAWTSGTANIVILPGVYATEPIPATQTTPVTVSSGTLTTLTTLTNITNWGNVADNAAFTDGTTRLSMDGFIFDDTAGTALTENDAAAARVNANRAQVMTIEDGATRGVANRVTVKAASTAIAATDIPMVVALSPNSVLNPIVTLTTTFTRPADTAVYTANDTMSDSTSAPTAGGFTITGASKRSGLGGIINSALIVNTNPAATPLQGELWIFDSAPTAINDNAAFALSDADAIKVVAVIPFTLATGATNNAMAFLSNLGIGFQCVGTANLRYLVKVINAYTPTSAEQMTVRLNITQGD